MIAFLLFASVDTYLSYSLFGAWKGIHPDLFYGALFILGILFLSQAWLFYVFFQSSTEEKIIFEKPLQKFAFTSMGLISFLFTFTAIRDLAGLLLLPFHQESFLYSSESTTLILALSGLCFTWGYLNARFKITSPLIHVPVSNLPEELSGLKIIQLSDVHLGTGPDTPQIKALVDRALSLRPDLIVLTGDIIDGATLDLNAELAELARLKAPYGTYFVLGNHECYWNYADSVKAMREIGITPLLNEAITLSIKGKSICIAGVTDPAMVHFKGEGPKIPVPDSNSNLNILLAHQPQIAKLTAELPYHLQLSGHTHGGQFFPWNLLVKRIYLHHGGLGKWNDLWVYVSHGTGYWGPPIRLGTVGEVTHLEIIRAGENQKSLSS